MQETAAAVAQQTGRTGEEADDDTLSAAVCAAWTVDGIDAWLAAQGIIGTAPPPPHDAVDETANVATTTNEDDQEKKHAELGALDRDHLMSLVMSRLEGLSTDVEVEAIVAALQMHCGESSFGRREFEEDV